MAKHLRRPSARQRVSRALVVPVAVVAAVAATAPAFAAKGGGANTTGGSTSASCSATPNPVAQNSDYTLSVRGLAAGDIVNVQVSDAGGTTVWQLQADSSGALSVVGHAWWTGTSTAAIKKQSRHSWSTLTSCTFSVV